MGSLCLMSQSFINLDSRWNITEFSFGISTPFTAYITYEYKFDDEAIMINDKTYYQLLIRQQETQPEWEIYNENIYYREEAGLVYRFDKLENKENLIYNFVIDSLPQTMDFSDDYVVIMTDTSNVTMETGDVRRSIKTQIYETSTFELIDTAQWIEGIGDLTNPFSPTYYFPLPFDSETNTLYCYYEQDELLFRTDDRESCYIYILDSEDNFQEESIKIYPVPFENSLTIDFASLNDKLTHLSINDASGKVVYESAYAEKITEVYLPILPKGVYFLKLISDKGHVFTRRIIKG
jgi:hypothetical protein